MAKVLAKKTVDKAITGNVEYIQVDPSKIVLGPDNPRTIQDKDADHKLELHLERGGMVPPIIVYRNDDGRLETVDGNRRLRIAQKLQSKGVPVRLEAKLIDEKDPLKRLALAIQANEGVNLNTVDRLHAYKRFSDAGWTGKQIADELSLTAGAISQGLDIMRYCSTDTLNKLKSGAIKFMQAYEIAKELKAKGAKPATDGSKATVVDPAKAPKGHDEVITKVEKDLLEKAEADRKQDVEQKGAMRQATRQLAQQGVTMTPLEKSLAKVLTTSGEDGGVAGVLSAMSKSIVLAKKMVPADAERGTKARYDKIKGQIDMLVDYYNTDVAEDEEEEERPTDSEPVDSKTSMKNLKGLLSSGKKAA
jgi:ParB-like chromosome segregation protein Spo0J